MSKINRVVVVSALVVLAATFYEVKLKPQSRPIYERALLLYRQEKFPASLLELERAYQIEPNSTAILVLRGWNYLKMRQYNDARENFGRAARLDPKLVEAQLGLAYVALETGQGEAPLAGVKALLEHDPSNADFRLANAVALRQSGQNLQAAEMFQQLMGSGRYGDVARRNLVEMYGLEGLNEPIPAGLPALQRPSTLQVNFKISGPYFQQRSGDSWTRFYVKGINLTAAEPGRFPSEGVQRTERYAEWLRQISGMGVNTIRAYSILPPAFYRALKLHNSQGQSAKLYLIQQAWLPDSEAANLFQSSVLESAKAEIRYAIDVIHGRSDVPLRKGRAAGLYTSDVSEYTIGLIIGRPLEPVQVIGNNEVNSYRRQHDGKYLSVSDATPTEVWLTSLADFAAHFETEQYNHQRPVGIASWPALDPLAHPSEATAAEEVAFRRKMGDRTAALPANEPINDNDTATIDETRIQVRPTFQGGIFAAYTLFPYYPDFMYRDPAYLQARDSEGPSPFFGYLKDLKNHYRNLAVLAGEYGASSSAGISTMHPLGWNHGGLSERQQGELLARMTRDVADAGLAGGLLASWQDQWHRTNWMSAPFALPEARRPLWHDALDPDQSMGVWTFDPSGARRFFPELSGWASLSPQYQKNTSAPALSDGWDAERTLRSLAVASDESYVYLRLQVEKVRKARDNSPDFAGANYYIGISTAPDRFGSQSLPGLSPVVRVDEGYNFLLHIGPDNAARLLVTQNYNPRELRPLPHTSAVQSVYRFPYDPRVEKFSPLEEIVVETNRRRYSRDGRMFPPQQHNRSLLTYRPSTQADDTVAAWTCDFASNAFVFRIPWGLLMVTDPSSRQVLARAQAERKFLAVQTSGLQLFAVSFRPAGKIQYQFAMGTTAAADSLPQRDGTGRITGLKTYSWPTWEVVNVQGRPKAAYAAVQKTLRELKVPAL